MKIISLGKTHHLRNTTQAKFFTEINFFSDDTVLDADIIIWDIRSSLVEVSEQEKTKNRIVEEKDYKTLAKQFETRREEINEFLSLGRTLFVQVISKHTAEIEVVSRISSTTSSTRSFNFWHLLPLGTPIFNSKKGTNIDYVKPDEQLTYLEMSEGLTYYTTISDIEGEPFLKIKGTNHIIGQFIRKEKASIFLLPRIEFPTHKFQIYDQLTATYLEQLVYLSKVYSFQPIKATTSFPNWTTRFVLPGEKEDKNRYQDLLEKKKQVENLILNQQEVIQNYQRLKVLIYGDGNDLEDVCELVFKEIGFTIEIPEPGRDDLIIHYADKVAVIEIKGLKGSAAEKNANQLMKWVTAYHDKHEIDPKGILIVNTYKETPLNERTGPDFPHQMLHYSTKREICLMTGKELLNIYLRFKIGSLNLEAVAEMLFNTIGVLQSNINLIEETSVE